MLGTAVRGNGTGTQGSAGKSSSKCKTGINIPVYYNYKQGQGFLLLNVGRSRLTLGLGFSKSCLAPISKILAYLLNPMQTYKCNKCYISTQAEISHGAYEGKFHVIGIGVLGRGLFLDIDVTAGKTIMQDIHQILHWLFHHLTQKGCRILWFCVNAYIISGALSGLTPSKTMASLSQRVPLVS